MKKVALLIIAIGLTMHLHGQTDDKLNQKVNLKYENVGIESIISELKTKYDIAFSYSNNIFLSTKKVTVDIQEKTLAEALKEILNQADLEFSNAGSQIILKTKNAKSKKYTLSGYLKDKKTGEDLIGASIYVKELKNGTNTNAYGYYSLTLDEGKYNIVISYIGYKNYETEIDLKSNQSLNFPLEDASITTNEVVITQKAPDENVQAVQMSVNRLTVEQMKKVPAIFGEVDVIKNIQQLPGVQSVGEGSSAFFVRGGSSDQNLILIDEAPVYNASHLAGIFSVFNADALKSADIYKGAIPAQYGGRLSSVVDIRSKDGNMKKFGGTVSLGLLSSKATLEGPIVKDKGSFIVSARRTYFDLFLKASNDANLRSTKLYFYDVNMKVNYNLGKKDRLFLASYFGKDVFGSGAFELNWGNMTSTLRWNHVFNPKLFSNTTAYYSNFNYGLGVNQAPVDFDWIAKIEEYALKQDFNYYLNTNNEIKFGVNVTARTFHPGDIMTGPNNTLLTNINSPLNNALEYAGYVSNDQKISNRFTLQYGLRYTLFQNNGTTINNYANGELEEDKITGTTKYDWNEVAKSYQGFEPRVGAKFTIDEKSSVKASYNRTLQFMHHLSNSASPIPITMWVPSTKYISPQVSDQFALGYFRNFFDNKVEFSIEGYYKYLNNTIDFKDNAVLLLNKHIETEVLRGTGYSYGGEFFAKKSVGKFNWQVAYTLSWTKLQINGINDNKEYFAPWDRRHNINMNFSYEFNNRISVGAAWTYGSGRPVTLPAAKYYYDYTSALYFTERNGERMPAFHRLDLSLNIKSKKLPSRKWEGMWNFSIYNAYNQKNPFSVYTVNTSTTNDQGETVSSNDRKIVMQYLFPILPSVSYTFSF